MSLCAVSSSTPIVILGSTSFSNSIISFSSFSNESKKYEYLGDGTAVKRDEVIRDYDNFSFSQDNGIICNGILDEIKRVGEQTIEEYTFTILYDTIPRFRLEKFCKLGDVTINDGIPHIALHFSSLADKYDKSTSENILPEIYAIFII